LLGTGFVWHRRYSFVGLNVSRDIKYSNWWLHASFGIAILRKKPIFCCPNYPDPGARIIASAVTIYNSARQSIDILLGKDTASLTSFTLKRQEKWISPRYEVNPLIKIHSESRIVRYILTRNGYYKIYWNKKYWDIKGY